ncbi:Gfo/Idh/MocA family protein [Alkalibacillus aidingensis]|uniref:Gfo/Idh/MocA family protein n=1 Tax=Alkalibacillus aidingensis TaxID=2747607 RepID=UPI001660D94C|nr:Gfo/Idh/MocA family oxidoreductase [Alkalibacillus aidingensis]
MVNVGLVGLGFIGKAHLEAYQKTNNAMVTSICTRSNQRDQDDLIHDDIEIVHEYEAILNNPNIDVVDLCLPTFLHEDYILKAVKANKHIICEKPLTLTASSADRIIQAVKDEGVQLFVGHVLRFWPEYQVLKEYSVTNQLPNIDWFQARRLGQFPTWSDWFKDPEKSGGALFDLHIHDIDFAYSLFGDVESVYAIGHQNEQGAWSQVLTTLNFKSGVRAGIEASHKMPNGYPFTMSYRAQSENKSLVYTMEAGENIDGASSANHRFEFNDGKKTSTLPISEQDPFQLELGYFIDCLEQQKKNDTIPLTDVQEVICIMEAIQKSLELNQVIHLKHDI